MMSVYVNRIPGLFWALLACFGCWQSTVAVAHPGGIVVAQAGQASESPKPEQPPAEQVKGLQLQPLDEPLTPFEPQRPATEKEKKQVEAKAWYMTGVLLESRNEFREAFDAFRKAAELDPRAVAVYSHLIPLAFNLGQTELAIEYALKAVEHDPDDFELLRTLGVHMATLRRIPEAIDFMERATKSKRLNKTSAVYVTLMRDLAVLYAATGETEKSADHYAVVFEALTDREKYQLDFQTRSRLLGDSGTTYERIGQVFLEAKRPELAIKAFQEAAKARKGNPGHLNFNLASVYLQTGKPERALEELQKYFDAQLQSKGREAYQLLADILAELKKSDELVPRLEKLAEKDLRNSTLQFFVAQQYVAADRLDDAEKLYQQVLERSNEFDGHLGLVEIYRRQSRVPELLKQLIEAQESVESGAAEALENALSEIEEDAKLVDKLIEAGQKLAEDSETVDFATNFVIARLATHAKRAEPAIAFSKRAFDSGDVPSADAYQELGQNLMQFDDYAAAAEVFQEASQSNKAELAQQKPNFLFLLSQAREMNGETAAALEALREARQMLPDQPLLHYQEAWVYYHSRQWDEAINRFKEIIEKYKQPEFKSIVRRSQYSLSNIYVQQGDIRKGEEVLEQVFAIEPDDPSVNNDLGYLYADQGKNLEQAEKMIRKAVEAEPDNVAYLDSLGWVLYKRGKFEEALAPLEKATQQPGSTDATIWDHLGDCYARLKQNEKAREAWEKALKQAKDESRPDEKLIQKIEAKLAGNAEPADMVEGQNAEAP